MDSCGRGLGRTGTLLNECRVINDENMKAVVDLAPSGGSWWIWRPLVDQPELVLSSGAVFTQRLPLLFQL